MVKRSVAIFVAFLIACSSMEPGLVFAQTPAAAPQQAMPSEASGRKAAVPLAPALEKARDHLYAGTLVTGERELAAMLATKPKEATIAFGLGTLRTALALEHLGQSLSRYRFNPGRYMPRFLNMMNIYVPVTKPLPAEEITYEKWRQMLLTLVSDLDKAEQAFALVGSSPVSFSFEPMKIRLDLNGDGTGGDDESLWAMAQRLTANRGSDNEAEEKAVPTIVVDFDTADAAWLRGYVNLVGAKAQFLLAYDSSESFPYLRDLAFFPTTKLPRLPNGEIDNAKLNNFMRDQQEQSLATLVAFTHTIRWPLAEPARLADAHAKLKRTIGLSRDSWRLIGERPPSDAIRWIPGPGAKGVLDFPVTAEIVEAWKEVLDDTEALLDGKKLAPLASWVAGNEGRGLNILRMFLEPKSFDLVLF